MISVRFILYNSACASHSGCWKRKCSECPALQCLFAQIIPFKNKKIKKKDGEGERGRRRVAEGRDWIFMVGSDPVFCLSELQYIEYDCYGERLIFKVPDLQLLNIQKSH